MFSWFMEKSYDSWLKWSLFVKVCLRKVPRPKVRSVEGSNVFRTLSGQRVWVLTILIKCKHMESFLHAPKIRKNTLKIYIIKVHFIIAILWDKGEGGDRKLGKVPGMSSSTIENTLQPPSWVYLTRITDIIPKKSEYFWQINISLVYLEELCINLAKSSLYHFSKCTNRTYPDILNSNLPNKLRDCIPAKIYLLLIDNLNEKKSNS